MTSATSTVGGGVSPSCCFLHPERRSNAPKIVRMLRQQQCIILLSFRDIGIPPPIVSIRTHLFTCHCEHRLKIGCGNLIVHHKKSFRSTFTPAIASAPPRNDISLIVLALDFLAGKPKEFFDQLFPLLVFDGGGEKEDFQ